jgi:hypothetical protein
MDSSSMLRLFSQMIVSPSVRFATLRWARDLRNFLDLPYSIINLDYVPMQFRLWPDQRLSWWKYPCTGRHHYIFYGTMWGLQYVAHIRNCLAPYHVIYTEVNNWIPGERLPGDPLQLSSERAVRLSQFLRSLLDPDIAILSAHSAAASTQESSRLGPFFASPSSVGKMNPPTQLSLPAAILPPLPRLRIFDWKSAACLRKLTAGLRRFRNYGSTQPDGASSGRWSNILR